MKWLKLTLKTVQQAVTSKAAALIAKDWTGGDGGKLVIEIGFAKGPNGNAEPTYSVKTLVKMAFAAYREDDQVWMGKPIGKEVTGAFNRCVAGLNYLLRSGEIAPDKNVDIWRSMVLGIVHGIFLS